MASFDVEKVLNLPNLGSDLKKIEIELRRVLISDNKYIQEPISRIINPWSKRLRPIMILAISRAKGVAVNNSIISGCVAVELVHLASLVHDDIIDESATRWNQSTINAEEGVNSAIIVGDYLFATANYVAAGISADVAILIAGTIRSLCDGESRELGDKYNINRTKASLNRAMKDKTAALFSCACQIGGLSAGMSEDDIASFGNYGLSFGTAFQIIDDLLNLLSSTELAGKPIGSDIEEGVYTLPVLLSLASPNSEKLKSLLVSKSVSSKEKIIELLLADGSIKKSIVEAKKYNQYAFNSLAKILNDKAFDAIANFPAEYLNFTLMSLLDNKYQGLVKAFIS